MSQTSITGAKRAAAVTLDRLKQHLPPQWFAKSKSGPRRKNGPRQIGLAISGGVDSMALATLCSQLQKAKPRRVSFHGFVVDHELREGSRAEAKKVARFLKKLEIQPKILKLNWKDVDPSTQEVPNMESNARRLRYRAIGAACRKLEIEDLLFAHHADDQSETALVRMANGYFGKGLAGMSQSSRIPECEGMYGVSSSGTPMRTKDHIMGIPVESGGVTVRRPLLDFRKDDLVATCEMAGVKWVEDHTNKDQTLTMRNTVRHLLNNDKLPEALRHDRIYRMVRSIAGRKARHEEAADKLFRECEIEPHLPSGTAECIIPQVVRQRLIESGDDDQVKVNLLRKLLLLVAPTDHIQDSSLELASRDFLSKIPVHINAGGAALVYDQEVKGGRRYLLSRNPPYASDKGTRVELRVKPRLVRKSPLSWSDWALWDGRYWIRVGTYKDEGFNVSVRRLTAEDIATLRGSKDVDDRHLRQCLAHVKAQHRSTLPVMVQTKQGDSGEPQEKILAMPTIQWRRSAAWAAWTSHEVKEMAFDPEIGRPAPFVYEVRFKSMEDASMRPLRLPILAERVYRSGEAGIKSRVERAKWMEAAQTAAEEAGVMFHPRKAFPGKPIQKKANDSAIEDKDAEDKDVQT